MQRLQRGVAEVDEREAQVDWRALHRAIFLTQPVHHQVLGLDVSAVGMGMGVSESRDGYESEWEYGDGCRFR